MHRVQHRSSHYFPCRLTEEAVKIAIRLDDIAPGMDWDKFMRFKALMDQYYVKPLYGIVPDNQDPKLALNSARQDFWELARRWQERDGWVPALHGLHHVYLTQEGGLFPLNHQSEFAGLPYETQEQMIRCGKTILENHGIVTQIFMAPSHTYDRSTIKALKACGFTSMTDGFGTSPYEYLGMKFYPISFYQKKSLKDRNKNHVITFVVHTATLTENDFARYEKIFREQDMLPYRELLYYSAAKRTAAGALCEHMMAKIKYAAAHAKRH